MTRPRPAAPLGLAAAMLALIVSASAEARQAQDPAAAAADTIEAINADFDRQYRELERVRLRRLAQLAASGGPEVAAQAYEALFRTAITAELFAEAEPIAEAVIRDRSGSAVVVYLAEVVNILAEADRGAFDESLESIVSAIRASRREGAPEGPVARAALPVPARLSLLDAYYQRLVQADQYDTVRRAFELVLENDAEGDESPIRAYLTNRVRQLDLIGKPAPAFEGSDVDGRPVRLADFEGDVVLLLFWATWYEPTAGQIAWLEEAERRFADQGFRVVGINVDALAEGEQPLESVAPEVRRYLIEHNVQWPNLINLPGDGDIAASYGVTEIPATVLIGRDGRIAHLDLTRGNLERVVAQALAAEGPPPAGR